MSPTAAPPRRRASTETPPPRRRPAPTTRAARASAPKATSITSPRTRPRPPVRAHADAPVRSTSRPTTRPAPTRAPARRVVAAPARTLAPARSPARRRARLVLVSGAVVAIVLTIVAFHVFLAQTQVRLERERAKIAVAEARYEAQRLRNGQLSSPARITGRAAELGLVVPTVAPVAVPMAGSVPARDGTSSPLGDWPEVKRHLDASP